MFSLSSDSALSDRTALFRRKPTMGGGKNLFAGERSINMGKGSRNREVRIADQKTDGNGGVKLSKLQLIKQQERKAAIKRTVTLVAAAILVVAVIVAIVVVSINKNPNLEGIPAGTSEKYEIDAGMMAYFYKNGFNNFVNQNYYYLSYYGLDINKSLKSQYISQDMTWFAYFMNQAKNDVNQLVALASEGQAKGVKLEEDDYKTIDSSIASMEAGAKSNGFPSLKSYLKSQYAGISEKTVRKCLELQQLASKYYNQLIETFTFTEEEISAYAEENPEKFRMTDFIFYTFTPDVASDADENARAAANAKAKGDAEELQAQATDEAAFRAAVLALLKAAQAEDSEKTDEELMASQIKEGKLYQTDDRYSEWAFADGREVGDTTVIENVSTSGTESTVTGYSVYYLTKTAYYESYLTKSVRHILLTESTYGTKDAAKAKLEEIMAGYDAGEKTEDAFAKLAEDYSEDGSRIRGGLYEEVVQDYMVQPFNDWIYDEARQPGDTGIIETEYGWHGMYFVGDGREAWKVNAEGDLKDVKFSETLSDLEKTYPVTYDADALTKIP